MNPRAWLLGCAFCFSAVVALPEPFLLVGGGAAFASQDTASNQPWDGEGAGVALLSYLDVTPYLGAYTAATLGVIVASHANGTALDVGRYQTLSLNALLGIGTMLDLAPLSAVGGVGVYLGANALNSQDNSLSSFAAGGVGGGLGLSLLYSLSYNWGIGLNVNAAYYFTIPGASAPTMAPSGMCVFGGIGVTYFFHPDARLGPGVSRY